MLGYEDENGSCHWTKKRFENVIALRQKALDTARKKWADYLFVGYTVIQIKPKELCF